MANPSDTELSFGDYVNVLKRRAPIFLTVTGAILLVGIAIAYRMPPKYESTGVLLAEQPEVPEHVVRSTVPNYPEERVRIITQRVLTADNLTTIVDDNELYPELAESPGAALRELRSNLSLSAEDPEILANILGASRSQNAIAFSISFRDSSPARARDVAEDLVSLYLEENQRARQEQAAETTRFLTREAEGLEQEIAEREQRLADFKEEHAGSLPELSDMNMQLLDRTERDLEDVEQEIRTLRERRSLYSSELAQLSPHETVVNEEGQTVLGPQDRLEMLQREYMRLSAIYSDQHPNVARVRREINALSESTGVPAFDRSLLQSELVARQQELDAALDRYSPSHPDVQRLQSRIQMLRDQLSRAPEGRAASTSAPADNPAYIQRQVQLEATNSELQAALDQRESLRARLTELEGRLTASPEVEREFNALQRGREQVLTQYADVERKLREAQIALNLESESRGERFTVLDSPAAAGSPAQPNRIAVLLLTVALAFALGAGSVATAESLDSTIRSARDITANLEMPPLVAIPQVNNHADVRRMYLHRFFATSAACAWVFAVAYLVLTPAG